MISAKISFNAIDEKDRMSLVPLHNPSQIVMLLNQNKNRKSGTNPGFQQWTVSSLWVSSYEINSFWLCGTWNSTTECLTFAEDYIWPHSEDFNVTLMVSVKTLIMSGSRWKTQSILLRKWFTQSISVHPIQLTSLVYVTWKKIIDQLHASKYPAELNGNRLDFAWAYYTQRKVV